MSTPVNVIMETGVASQHGNFKAGESVQLDYDLPWVRNWIETKVCKPLGPLPVSPVVMQAMQTAAGMLTPPPTAPQVEVEPVTSGVTPPDTVLPRRKTNT
jgi:hypothetical protein